MSHFVRFLSTICALLVVVAPWPLAAQSAATCVAYMEADATFTIAKAEADAVFAAAKAEADAALSAAKAEADAALNLSKSEAYATFEAARAEAEYTRKAAEREAKQTRTLANNDRNSTISLASTDYNIALSEAKQRRIGAKKRADDKYNSIRRNTNDPQVHRKAGKEREVAKYEANVAYETTAGELSAVRDAAIRKAEVAYKVAIAAAEAHSSYERVNEIQENMMKRAEDAYRVAMVKPTAAHEAAMIRAKAAYRQAMDSPTAIHEQAIGSVESALVAAYLSAYDGERSDVDSVMMTLLQGSRSRCEQMFGG